MQEINLLQNKVKDRTLRFERSNRLVVGLFSLIVILEFVATGGLYFLANNTNKQTADVVSQNQSIQTAMVSNQKDLTLAKGLQAQLKNVNTLLQNHIYWSAFLTDISAIVPVKVQYNDFQGSITDDKITIDGMASSYADVGRMLLALSTSDKFSSVKLVSLTPAQGSLLFKPKSCQVYL